MSTTFLTSADIAEILKISKSLAYRLVAQGEIPSFRFGRVSRVRQEDLEAFIQKNTTKPHVDEAAAIDTKPSLDAQGAEEHAPSILQDIEKNQR